MRGVSSEIGRVGGQVMGQVSVQVYGQVMGQVSVQVYGQVWGQVGGQGRGPSQITE